MPKWHRNISCSYRNNSCGDKGNRVKGYLIASSHCTVKVPGKKKRQKILKHPDVKTWLQGLPMSNPELISIIPWWDLQVVLSALKQLPYYPLVKPPLSPYPQSHDPYGTDFGKTGIFNNRSLPCARTPFRLAKWLCFSQMAPSSQRWLALNKLPVLEWDPDKDLHKFCVAAFMTKYWKHSRQAEAPLNFSSAMKLSGVANLYPSSGSPNGCSLTLKTAISWNDSHFPQERRVTRSRNSPWLMLTLRKSAMWLSGSLAPCLPDITSWTSTTCAAECCSCLLFILCKHLDSSISDIRLPQPELEHAKSKSRPLLQPSQDTSCSDIWHQ